MSIAADASYEFILFSEREHNRDIELVINDLNEGYDYQLDTAFIQTLNIGGNKYEDQQQQFQPAPSFQYQSPDCQLIQPCYDQLSKLKQYQCIYFKVCEFLGIQDLIQLQLLNNRFLFQTKKVSLKWAVYNSNDSLFWSTVTDLPTLFRTHSQQYSVLGINYDEESQHSRDLDRTFLLEDNQIIENNKLKLDRVLRVLTKNGLYFQGLNYIASAFLAEHPEENSYWYTRYILYKAGNFQNNLEKLNNLLKVLESMMRYHLPLLLNHLESQDLTMQYFADKWFIAMYSYDTSIQLMLKLWKLIVLSDENMMVCFTISLLKKLQPFLLELQQQDLNILLKTRLKETINQLSAEQLLLTTIDLYMKEFSDINFGFDQTELQENIYKNQIYLR